MTNVHLAGTGGAARAGEREGGGGRQGGNIQPRSLAGEGGDQPAAQWSPWSKWTRWETDRAGIYMIIGG